MLIIRKEQMDVFNAYMRRTLVDPLVSHMREHFPEHCEILGDAQVRQTVELGLERASQYGLLAEREVFLYVSLMFMLGSGFDTDFQLPWAGAMLMREDFPDSYTKIQTLYEAAMEYLDRVIGEDEEEHVQVMLRVNELDLEAAIQRITRNFSSGMIELLSELHPRKVEELGDEGLQRLIAAGTESAMKYGLAHDQGRMVYVLHMFILGSAFDTDPQFHWAQDILNDASISSESEKTERLYKAAMAYVEELLYEG